MSRLAKWSAMVAALALLAIAGQSDAATTPANPTVDPTAKRILMAATDYLKQQANYSFSADVVFDDVLPPDFKIQHHASAQYSVHRPNQLRVDYTGDRRQASFYIDGKNFTLYDRAANAYGVLAASNNIETTLNAIFDKYDFTVPLADVISNDPYKAFARSVEGGYYVGKSSVGGFSTHHLVFSQKDLDWQLWVDDGPQPLIRELQITYRNLPGQPEYMATFTDWKFTPTDPAAFSFVPPKNAVLIDFVAVQTTKSGTVK